MIDSDAQDSAEGLASEESTNEISPTKMKQKKQQLRQNQLVRENRRLRNSASFRIGKLFTRAATKPWLLPLLPFSILFLVFSIGMERLGRWPVPVESKGMRATSPGKPRDCVMFFPTNGVGFGHFTRMYALAKRFKKYSPSTEIVFFTTMPTLHLLYNEGFVTYHIAGRKKFDDLSASDWNALVEEHLSLAFNQHRPSTFIYDGAFPYRGMLNAIREQSQTRKIWMRRGTFKKGSRIPVDSIAHFDTIVHPQDSVPLAQSEVDHGVESITCAPIVLLDESDLLPRDIARRRLNLPLTGRTVYVQLGAGRINDIDSEVRMTVEALLKHEDITVVVGESMLGERIDLSMNRVVLLRDYPNSMYFRAFDATVQAGGYNSFHETRRFGLPALFYPNMNTGMDDQLARCKVAEDEGWGIVVVERNHTTITDAIGKLLSSTTNFSPRFGKNGALEMYHQIKLGKSTAHSQPRYQRLPQWASQSNTGLTNRINQRFLEINGYEMDWEKPETFNHHIQLLKFSLGEEESRLTDKFRVREHVSSIIGDEYLIPLVGVYDSVSDLDIDPAATDIVMKTNHGSGPEHCEVFPSNRSAEELKLKFENAMSNEYYGVQWGEFQYQSIPRKLIVERKIGTHEKSPLDYKFHMFNNGSKEHWFLQINSDRESALKQNFYDEKFEFIDVTKSGLPNGEVQLPDRAMLQEMLNISRKLSAKHRYVRVDLYLIERKIYFGELTFTPACGFGEFSDMQISNRFGSYFPGGEIGVVPE